MANFVLNRRQFTPRGVILGMNPRGPADRTVPVLRIDTPEGKLRAVLFGAATHNTTLRGNCYEICGDYAGFAQADLEKQHPGVQAMFILGFAGDSDPYPHGTMDLARKHGRELSQEVERLLGAKLEPVRGPLRLAFAKADLPLDVPARAQLEHLHDAIGARTLFATHFHELTALEQTLSSVRNVTVAVDVAVGVGVIVGVEVSLAVGVGVSVAVSVGVGVSVTAGADRVRLVAPYSGVRLKPVGSLMVLNAPDSDA